MNSAADSPKNTHVESVAIATFPDDRVHTHPASALGYQTKTGRGTRYFLLEYSVAYSRYPLYSKINVIIKR